MKTKANIVALVLGTVPVLIALSHGEPWMGIWNYHEGDQMTQLDFDNFGEVSACLENIGEWKYSATTQIYECEY